MKAVMYGAGNIGRGFIGQVFFLSGFDVDFVDVNKEILSHLNADREYPVRILHGDRSEEMTVKNVTGIDAADESKVARAIAETDILATAVGVNVLKHIAPNLAAGLRLRYKNGGRPLNIIICENMLNADRHLKGLVSTYLMPEEYHWMLENVGFVEASIGRMVPVQTPEMQEGNPLRVCTESYDRLPVDKDAFVGEIPEIKGLVPYSPFEFYIERKLFIHNLGHAAAAYFGSLHGDEFIWQAVERAEVRARVKAAMEQSAAALAKKHSADSAGLSEHIEDLLARFANRQLGDTVSRVGGDLRRKLGPRDRMLGALNLCAAENLPFENIALAIAAALLFKEDSLVSEMSSEKILTEISEIPKNSPLISVIISCIDKLKS